MLAIRIHLFAIADCAQIQIINIMFSKPPADEYFSVFALQINKELVVISGSDKLALKLAGYLFTGFKTTFPD